MYEKTVTNNGLRILTSHMPHTKSVSIAFYVGAGSRYEAPEAAGDTLALHGRRGAAPGVARHRAALSRPSMPRGAHSAVTM